MSLKYINGQLDGQDSVVVTLEGTHQELHSSEAQAMACNEAQSRFHLSRPGLGRASGVYPVDDKGQDLVRDNTPIDKNAAVLRASGPLRREFVVNGEP